MIKTLHLGLSYACNMKCKHCFVEQKMDSEMETEYKSIIRKASKKGVFSIVYSFGEPTLSPILEDVILYASEYMLIQTMMTNGYFLTSDRINSLHKKGLSRIFISLDSHKPEVHNNNRGVKDSFEKAIKAIDIALNSKIQVGVAHTITENNFLGLLEFYEFIKNKGVKNISLLALRDEGKIHVYSNMKIYFDNIEKIIEMSSNDGMHIYLHDYRLISTINKLYINGRINGEYADLLYQMNSCHRESNISIAPDGSVSKCNFSRNSKFNIFKDNVFDEVEFETDTCFRRSGS